MESYTYTHYSNYLHRLMPVTEIGDGPVSCLIIPTEGGRYYDFENFGLADACREVLNSGKIRLFCCDSIDHEGLCCKEKSIDERLFAEEKWVQYCIRELCPFIRRHTQASYPSGTPTPLYVAGCGMGGYQAANLFFRNPKLFSGVISLSGFFDLSEWLDDALSDEITANSPWHLVYSMSEEKRALFVPDTDLAAKEILLGCGGGDWEDSCAHSLKRFASLLEWKHIPASILSFGKDFNHDWDAWQQELPLCLKKLHAFRSGFNDGKA